MSNSHRPVVHNPFFRSIGCLSLATFELQQLRLTAGSTDADRNHAWAEFADHLLASSHAVMAGACGSTFPGGSIHIDREGVQIAIDETWVDRLADKTRRHVTVGRALGIGETADTLAATA